MMGEFFRGWKRKVGCLTLLMACVLMAGWVRSQLTADLIYVSTGEHAFHQILSEEHGITWQRAYDPQFESTSIIPVWLTYGVPFFPKDETPASVRVEYAVWRWSLWAYSLDDYSFAYAGNDPHLAFWTIPYWCLVFPLTLASAYLLVITPHSAKTKSVEDH